MDYTYFSQKNHDPVNQGYIEKKKDNMKRRLKVNLKVKKKVKPGIDIGPTTGC